MDGYILRLWWALVVTIEVAITISEVVLARLMPGVSFDIIRMNKSLKLDVFGKLVLAVQTNDGWEMFYLSEGGKRRLATEIFVPNFVKETEIEKYIEDICHEWATEKHPNVRRLN